MESVSSLCKVNSTKVKREAEQLVFEDFQAQGLDTFSPKK